MQAPKGRNLVALFRRPFGACFGERGVFAVPLLKSDNLRKELSHDIARRQKRGQIPNGRKSA